MHRNGWAAASRELAPTGATAIRLCRYDALNVKPPMELRVARQVTSPSQLVQLVRELDSLKQLRGTVACPVDNGSQILALISYPKRHRVTISVGLSGCSIVTNGNLRRSAMNIHGDNPVGPELVAQLKRLTQGAGATSVLGAARELAP